jgi:hypothetical protein
MARNASNADICYFSITGFCLLTFWFTGFMFKHKWNQACETHWCLQAEASLEICHHATQFEKFMERKCWAYDGCAWEVSGPRVVLLPLYFQEWGSVVKYCWNRFISNFSFQNKFIILLPYGLLQDNTFLTMCISIMHLHKRIKRKLT